MPVDRSAGLRDAPGPVLSDALCLELKSLKYYLLSYRSVGIVQEGAANRILEDLVRVCAPKRMTVVLDYEVRRSPQRGDGDPSARARAVALCGDWLSPYEPTIGHGPVSEEVVVVGYCRIRLKSDRWCMLGSGGQKAECDLGSRRPSLLPCSVWAQ